MRKRKGIVYVNLKNNLINEVTYPSLFIKRVAEKGGFDISKFDINQVANGFKIELEHGKKAGIYNVTNDDPVKTLKITLTHMSEDPEYYPKLLKYIEGGSATPEISTAKMVHETKLLNQGNHKLYITKSVDNIDENKTKLIAEFIKFCAKHLGINHPITVHMTGKRGGPIQTTASYNPNTHEIWIYVKNRNMLADPLRSLAHEIRHLKQGLDGVLHATSGDDGSEHEGEAHSFSGLMIRLFGKMHPEIFQ